MVKKYLPVLVFLLVFGCGQEKSDWNPVFEETEFDYLKTNLERSLALIDEVVLEAGDNQANSAVEKIEMVKSRLLELKDYYIPLTTVRQNVYDAERYFKLKDKQKVQRLFSNSKSIITALQATTRNQRFDKVTGDLNDMIDAVVTAMEKDSNAATNAKMKQLAEHINLMLTRGDLVLSGIEFEK